jgi:hypothetical protein
MRKQRSTSERHSAPPLIERGPSTRQSFLRLGHPAFDNNANRAITFHANSQSCKQANYEN